MTSYLLNLTLQIIECFICFSFYESISMHKTGFKKRFGIMFVCYLIMYAANIGFDYNAIINMLLMVLFHSFFGFKIYKFNIVFSVLYSILVSTIVAITEICVINFIAVIFNTDSKAFISNTLNYILVIIISKSLLLIILRLISGIINKSHENERINWTFLTYPISLLLVLISYVYISYEYKINDKTKVILSVLVLLLTFSVIITCIYQQISSRREKELLELKAESQKQELNNTYFELLEHQNKELQLFVHDTKKHLWNIYDFADKPSEIRDYVKTLVEDIDYSNQIGKSSNKLLDLILIKYDYICQKNNITFEKNIHRSDLNFIIDTDLTSIFNNLLDNAIDAAKISEKKYILMSINIIEDMIHIDIINSCDTPPKAHDKKLITTKSDKVLHGYGFKSITRTVKKYDGDIDWDYDSDNKEFIISIIFSVE